MDRPKWTALSGPLSQRRFRKLLPALATEAAHEATLNTYLTESVYKVVLQKSIPPQIRQLIPYISNDKGFVV